MRIAAAFVIVGSLVAGDWPQWRGANRDGVSTAATPASWPEKLNQKWKVTVGEGHASPISAAGRIYVFARQGEQEVARAIDAATGQTRWEQRYAAPYTMHMAATAHGKGPKSTPLLYENKLYTFGISGTLTCFDAGSGRVLWRNDFGGRFKHTSPAFGSAMSPAIDHGLLIVHAGGDGEGALTAFDPQSGVVKWTWNGDGPAYASPVVAEIAGTRQIVTQSQRHIIGVAAASGELLWKIPYRTNFEQNAITPVVYKDLLILSGLDNGIMAIRISRAGNAWRTERVWDNAQTPMYMSTPVLADDLLFGFTHKNKGQFVCLDARSGQTLWSGPPRQGDNAAIVRDGDHLFLLKNDAELVIARAGAKGFEPLRTYTVADSPTWAHPLLLDDGVIVKDTTTLARWTWK